MKTQLLSKALNKSRASLCREPDLQVQNKDKELNLDMVKLHGQCRAVSTPPQKLTKSLLTHRFMAAQKPSAAKLMHREQSYIGNIFMARNYCVIHTNDWAPREFTGHTDYRGPYSLHSSQKRDGIQTNTNVPANMGISK